MGYKEEVCDLMAEIASLRAQNELTHVAYVDENNRLMAEREAFRAELAAIRMASRAAENAMNAAARQDAQSIKDYIAWVESLQHEARQDAEAIARLQEALKPFAQLAESIECTSDHTYDDGDHWEIEIGALRNARAALACRPQGERSET